MTGPSLSLAARWWFLLAVLLGVSTIRGQVAPPAPPAPVADPANEEVVELSPFTITAQADKGYQARSTLAGSRLNAELTNVPAQISVMTKDFLEDISAGTLEEALPYSLNVEGISEFSSAEAGRRNFIDNINDGQSNRARGLTGAGTTMNFFPTDIPMSTYNVDRYTFLSGPNAILYGSGSPAGIVDASLLKVRNLTRTQLKLSTRTDSEESWRHTLDLSVPLKRDVFGVRIAAQNEDTNSFKRPAGNRDDRVYGTFLLRPFEKTTIRGWFEAVRIKYTPVRTTQVFDSITHWLDAGRPLYNNAPGQPQPPNNGPVISRDNTNAVRQFFVVGQTLAPVPTVSWRGSAMLTSLEEARPNPDAFWHALQDPTVFPRDVSVWGNAFGSRTRGKTYGLSIEHQFTPALWADLSLYHQASQLRLARNMSPIDMALRADPNMFLPGTNIPNPNAGRYYIQSEGGQQNKRERRQQSLRAALVYQHDFSRQRPWLGRHRLSGTFEMGENDNANQTHSSRIITPVAGLSDDLVNTAGDGSRRPILRAYVDDPRDPASKGVYWVNLPYDVFADKVTFDDGTVINLWDLELYGSGNQGSWTRTNTRGYVIAAESFFLRERLAITAGARRDESRIRRAFSDRLGDKSVNAGYEPFTRLKGKLGPAERQEGDTLTAGAVFHVRKGISVFANRSETYTPPPQGYNPDGSLLDGSTGVGTDFGVMLTLLEDRLSLRANRFKNTSENVGSSFQTDIAGRIYDIERTVVQAGAPMDPGGYNPMIDSGSYFVRGSRESEGYEFELTANPTRNWRVQTSFARSKSHETNVGRPWVDLAMRRVATWSRYPTEIIWEGTVPVRNRFNSVAPPLVEMIGLEGLPVEQGRNWRFNATTRYSFDRSWLKGAFAGGSLRYRSKNVVGFAQKEVPNPFASFPGQLPAIGIKDADRPYYGKPQESVDAFIGYSRKLAWARSVTWRVQLAVKNVFDNDTLQIQGVYSNGDLANFTIPEPRRWLVTATFEF